jgi:hypothetical protein
MQAPGPPGWGLDARLMTLLCKIYHFEIKSSGNRMVQFPGIDKSGRIFYGYGSKRAVWPVVMMIFRREIVSYNGCTEGETQFISSKFIP